MTIDNKTLALIEDIKNKRGFIYNQLIERGLKVDVDIIDITTSDTEIVLWLTRADGYDGFIGISAYRDYTFTIFHIGELVGKIERGKKVEILEKYLDDDIELTIQKAPVYNERYIIKMCKIYKNRPYYAARMFYKNDIRYMDLILDELKIMLESEIERGKKNDTETCM